MQLYQLECDGYIHSQKKKKVLTIQTILQVDIVHTELCTLHFNPAL